MSNDGRQVEAEWVRHRQVDTTSRPTKGDAAKDRGEYCEAAHCGQHRQAAGVTLKDQIRRPEFTPMDMARDNFASCA